VGLERGPLSLVSITEELLVRNSTGFGLENREYGRGDPLRWPHGTLYPQKLALTSPTCGGRSVGIVRLRTTTTEFIMYGWDLLQVLQFFFIFTKYIDSAGFYSMAELLRSPLYCRTITES
jgi:hypothetical protein